MDQDHSHVAARENDAVAAGDRDVKPLSDLSSCLREYAREHPVGVALTCLGLGVFLGWRLKR